MSPDVRGVIEEAIDYLANIQASAGSNDLEIPDTPEMRALYHEYSLHNCPEATTPEHDQYLAPGRPQPNKMMYGHDSFAIFLLRRELGLLNRGT